MIVFAKNFNNFAWISKKVLFLTLHKFCIRSNLFFYVILIWLLHYYLFSSSVCCVNKSFLCSSRTKVAIAVFVTPKKYWTSSVNIRYRHISILKWTKYATTLLFYYFTIFPWILNVSSMFVDLVPTNIVAFCYDFVIF